ncbi:AbiH family protein [Paenibacillus sp. R14(2021)]|uniref:AbiH family protein n=1 Tax=Paenibacillus sp. R14(2021) TaxID=2859228 RepID=UPI001C613143|nr:AbiH family protein [Paenibacillus sp. R14(2021)]
MSEENILHIHDSTLEHDIDPVLGHGNAEIISSMKERHQVAENRFEEKEMSICYVVHDYYVRTFKEINEYMPNLRVLKNKEIDGIIVIGHSLAGVDLPYFKEIDSQSLHKAKWQVYYFYASSESEQKRRLDALFDCGIEIERITLIPSNGFFNR